MPKIYHPFIYGAHNENLNAMMNETGARINIPPLSVQNDEITIAGEKEGVLLAKQKIEHIYKDMVYVININIYYLLSLILTSSILIFTIFLI